MARLDKPQNKNLRRRNIALLVVLAGLVALFYAATGVLWVAAGLMVGAGWPFLVGMLAVVGILGAALYDPLWTSAVGSPRDFALALTCFVALMSWKFPPSLVVLIAAAGGAILEVSSMS